MILGRISGGHIRAVAEHVDEFGGNGRREAEFAEIRADQWASTSIGSIFWLSGDATFRRNGGRRGDPDRITTCTGIRLDPDGVQRLLAQLPPDPRRPPPRPNHFPSMIADEASDTLAAKTTQKLAEIKAALGGPIAGADPPGLLHSDVFRDPEVAELKQRVAELEAAKAVPAAGPPPPTDLDSLPPKRGRPSAEFWEDLIIEMARRMHMGDFKPKTQAEVEDAMARWILDRGYSGGRETQVKERARKVFKSFRD